MATCPSCGGSGTISDEQFKKDFNDPNIKISGKGVFPAPTPIIPPLGQGQGQGRGNARWEWVWDGAEWKQRFNSGGTGTSVMGAASPGPAPTTPGTTVGQVWGQGKDDWSVGQDYQRLPATPTSIMPVDVNDPAYQAKLAAAKESSQAKIQESRYKPLENIWTHRATTIPPPITPPQIKQQDYARQIAKNLAKRKSEDKSKGKVKEGVNLENLVENRRKGMSSAYPSSNTSPSQYSFGQPTTQDKKRTSINTHLARMTGQGTY